VSAIQVFVYAAALNFFKSHNVKRGTFAELAMYLHHGFRHFSKHGKKLEEAAQNKNAENFDIFKFSCKFFCFPRNQKINICAITKRLKRPRNSAEILIANNEQPMWSNSRNV